MEHALEAALGVALACNAPHAADLLAGRLRLVIALCADNEFYSQRATVRPGSGGGVPCISAPHAWRGVPCQVRARGLPFTRESLASLPPFLPCTAAGSTDVPKTGMGSSATLVTSLVAAVLSALEAAALPGSEAGAAPLTGRVALHAVHRAAQAAHVRAQGKVGSGFDICAATYGSCSYVRFSPSCVTAQLDGPRMHAGDLVAGLLPGLPPRSDAVPAAWDHCSRPLSLPPGLSLAMADVSAGTNTRLAVKRVQQWRREGGAVADAVWDALAACNGRIAAGLRRVAALARATSAEDARAILAATPTAEEAGGEEGEAVVPAPAPAPTEWYSEASAACADLCGEEVRRRYHAAAPQARSSLSHPPLGSGSDRSVCWRGSWPA